MTVKENQKGFTLVEIILFLALSGLFLLVAFTGIRGRTSAVQFTDSMRSLENFLAGEENRLLNGVNPAPNSPVGCSGSTTETGKSGGCVLIGRVVTFGEDSSGTIDPSSMTVQVLYGDKLEPEDLTGVGVSNDIQLIHASNPAVAAGTASTRDISWGTKFLETQSVDTHASGVTIKHIGWLRSPSSSRIVPIVFYENVPNLSDNDNYHQSGTFTLLGDQVETRLCFEGADGKLASITFGDGSGSSALKLEFDDARCAP